MAILSLQELTYIIKQDIADINKRIANLQTYVKQRNSGHSPEGKLVEEHTNNVVMLLQSKLANTSITFKDVLEVRTQVRNGTSLFRLFFDTRVQNMKESKTRTEQFMYSAASAATQAPSSMSFLYLLFTNSDQHLDSVLYSSSRGDPMGDGTTNHFDFKGKGRATPNNDELAMDLRSTEAGDQANGHAGGALLQMQLVEQQVCRLHCSAFIDLLIPEPSRTHISNSGQMPLRPSKPPSLSLARSLLSSRIWLPSNEKWYNVSMTTS